MKILLKKQHGGAVVEVMCCGGCEDGGGGQFKISTAAREIGACLTACDSIEFAKAFGEMALGIAEAMRSVEGRRAHLVEFDKVLHELRLKAKEGMEG